MSQIHKDPVKDWDGSVMLSTTGQPRITEETCRDSREGQTHSPTSGRLQALGSDSSTSSNFLLWSMVKNLQRQVQLIQQARGGAPSASTGLDSPFVTAAGMGQRPSRAG